MLHVTEEWTAEALEIRQRVRDKIVGSVSKVEMD